MKTVKINNVEVSIEELKKAIKENPELLKESKKPWRGEEVEYYWHVFANGEVNMQIECNNKYDNYHYLTGNYFKTQEEAEKYRDRQEAIGRVTHAILEANGEWEPDWSDRYERKYHIYYDHKDKEFNFDFNLFLQHDSFLPPIKSEEIAEQIIKDHLSDLKLIWGV